MKKLEYTVQFVTPAFLGNAEQSAQWRTPPFKTMLRQWWRVLNAKRFNYDEYELNKREGDIFGKALDGDSAQSKIRIRLEPMAAGGVTPWSMPATTPIDRPTLEQVYIGYGPITNGSVKKAIPTDQKAKLKIIFDDSIDEAEIKKIIWLANNFSAIGSRSRNGWGSLSIIGDDEDLINSLPTVSINTAFQKNWTHGIGVDIKNDLLIWKTPEKRTWQDLMRTFQQVRKEYVNKIVISSMRQNISYPVTKNNSYDSKYRLPSQLIFKAKNEGAGVVGYIIHMPHGVPLQKVDNHKLADTWGIIHNKLDDKSSGLIRVRKLGE